MRKIIGLLVLGILFVGMLGCTATTNVTTAGSVQLFTPQVKKTIAASNSTAVDSEGGIDHIVLGYYTGTPASYFSVEAFSNVINMVAVDVFTVQMDGSISGSDALDIHSLADSFDIQLYACVSNYNNDPSVNGFDSDLAHIAIDTRRARMIENLVSLASQEGYSGINIDLENLAYSKNIEDDRAAFTLFIQELAATLHKHGLKLIISVPGKTDDLITNTWAYPFDLAVLGSSADYLQLMTYDQHGPWSEPGAVAGADWVEECLRYTASLVDPAKLLIGLPAYGYDWDLADSAAENNAYDVTAFSWVNVPELLAKPGAEISWNSVSHSPSVIYTEAGHEHIAWYENAESIRIKTKLVQQYKLAGLSMWALGKEDESFWQAAMEGLE